ncbi:MULTISPECIES: hypothetical protein [unclassified Mycobacterium]|uniref:aa3-type cytochrome oxidase subunit CtaJ n=1 Tax=unclassified Mycobacterium TaxID=2642494 RepID=UPI0029C77DBA|nr:MULTISPECIES: hypothetical protein [unclassified Mycobacterium]
MSIALTHSLLGGVPLLVLLVLAVLIFRHKGPHPATYKLSEEWTHAPILWAADEPADHGHGGHDSHVTVGGGASGKW